tara:strand:+ start:153 stop:635 length:483 start_codon:yes stop_codon:yes gene_type:complete
MFLAEAVFGDVAATGGVFAGFLAMAMAFLAIFVLIVIGVYIYSSFAYMAIGRKAKYGSPALAWIPLVGKPLVALKVAGMAWWPLLFLIGYIIPAIGGLLLLAFGVFNIIWNWKMMKAVGRPGWWAIFMLIYPIYLILLGVAAWGNASATPAKSGAPITKK